jgi:flagellar biogenesis protein FliO
MRNEQPDKPEPSVAHGLGVLAAVLAIILAFAWGLAALFKWVL